MMVMECKKKREVVSGSKIQVDKGLRQFSELWLNLCSLR